MGMMNLTADRAFVMEFYQALENTPLGWVDPVSMLLTSEQATETFRWAGMTPGLRQWTGERGATGLKDYNTSITQYPYEASLEFLRREWVWDKTGLSAIRVRDLAGRVQQHWAELLTALIVAAESTACYDGQYFFDTDHAEGSSGTQSNDLSNGAGITNPTAGEAPTVAEMRDYILTAIKQIRGFKDDQGKPINETANSFLVMIPLGLEPIVAKALLTDVIIESSVAIDNVIRRIPNLSIEYVVNPRLDATSTWYSDGYSKLAVFRTDSPIRPFIRVEEPGGIRTTALGLDSEYCKTKNRCLFGVEIDRGVGYGMWQNACLVTLADA